MAGGIMKMKIGFGAVLVACLFALIQVSSAATSHTVGDSTGWTIPSSSSLYSTWAAKQTVIVGDSLVFNFATGSHTVAEVSKSDYDSCTTTNPLSTATTGPATIIVSSAGAHYYICTISGHCNAGQKLAITTTTATSSPPPSGTAASPVQAPSAASGPSSSTTASSSPPPSDATTSPGPSSSTTAPPPSSDATVAGGGLVLPFLLVVLAFLF